MLQKCEKIRVISNYLFSNIVIAMLDISLSLLVTLWLLIYFEYFFYNFFGSFLNFYSFRSFYYRKSWKSDNFTRSNLEKKQWTNLQNKKSKEIKIDDLWYRKVGRMLTKKRAISILGKLHFYSDLKIILHFGVTNNVFVYYTLYNWIENVLYYLENIQYLTRGRLKMET